MLGRQLLVELRIAVLHVIHQRLEVLLVHVHDGDVFL